MHRLLAAACLVAAAGCGPAPEPPVAAILNPHLAQHPQSK